MRQTGNVERCLQELGYAVVPTKGTSMWPLLKEDGSWVQVTLRDSRQLKPGDVVLYRIKDDTLVLHRIIRVEQADTYWLCGDHQWQADELVKDEQILAVAQGFVRNGHYFDDRTWWYRLYRILWNGNLTARRCCLVFLRLTGLEKRDCPGRLS